MKHLIFLVHIISFFSGIINLIIARFICLKEQIEWIKTYIFFMGALTALVLAQTITSYNLVNIVDFAILTIVLNMISYSATAVMIYEMPKLIYQLIQKEWLKGKLFGTLSVLQIIYLLMYYMTPYKPQINFIASGSLFSVLLYSVILVVKHYKDKTHLALQKEFKYFMFATIICIPYMYLDTKTEQIVFLNKYFPYGLLSLPIYYLLCNLISIHFEMRYIKSNTLHLEETIEKDENPNKDESSNEWEVFYEKYHITNREQEIMRLLIKGESYTEIAQHLVISGTTVKTHVHHIYQKTGVKNKIQLIQLVKNDI